MLLFFLTAVSLGYDLALVQRTETDGAVVGMEGVAILGVEGDSGAATCVGGTGDVVAGMEAVAILGVQVDMLGVAIFIGPCHVMLGAATLQLVQQFDDCHT